MRYVIRGTTQNQGWFTLAALFPSGSVMPCVLHQSLPGYTCTTNPQWTGEILGQLTYELPDAPNVGFLFLPATYFTDSKSGPTLQRGFTPDA